MGWLLSALRSLFALFCIGALFITGSVRLRLWVMPQYWLHPERRFHLVSVYMKWMSRWILNFMVLGGARIRRSGTLPTTSPALVVANHQSLIDICQITLMSDPFVPAFVSRTRYARFVPLVSESLRMLGAPLVDPERDPRAARDAVRVGARTLPHGIMIFPEGHRSRDGEIQRFRRAGLEAILAENRWPVYMAVGDGAWKAAKLTDMLFGMHKIDAYTEAFGPFEPPEDPTEIPRFIRMLRETMIERLQAIRAQRAEGRSAAAAQATAQ